MKSLLAAARLGLLVFAGSSAAAAALDTKRISELTGLAGTWNADEGVYKVTSPRNDLPVSVDGWKMPPFMGLTSWASFMAGGKAETMVMGDLVLFEDEINPVMSSLFASGLQVTALHNHFFFDDPHVYFMHLGGEGPADQLAKGVQLALAKVKEIRGATPTPRRTFGAPVPSPSTIAAGPLEAIMGGKAQTKDGMAKFVIGRDAKMECGCTVGKEMGLNTWAAFAGNDGDAVVDGDFAVRTSELQGVLKSLRQSGINIVAIHHHMTEEDPRYFFLHYWGRGSAAALATSLKAALDTTGK